MGESAAYLFLVSFLAMKAATPLAIHLGRRWGVLDHPSPRKIHKESTPLTGGWAIFLVLSIVLWGHLLLAIAFRQSPLLSHVPPSIRHFIVDSPKLALKVAPLYGSALLIFLLGLFDDVRGLKVRTRLVFQVLVAVGLVLLGVRPNLLFLPYWIGAAVGVVWIVGITNAFNFLDGLDGLSTGVAFVANLALMAVVTLGNLQPDMIFLIAAVAGIQLGFLRYNWQPARIFLGSSGSLLIGHLLATSTSTMTFQVPTNQNWLIPILTPIFILAIPIYDTCSVVLIRFRNKRPITRGDQSHFHHRLMRLGFTHMQTVVFICTMAFAIGLGAVLLVKETVFLSFLSLLQIAALLFILVLAERVAYRVRERALLGAADVPPAPPKETGPSPAPQSSPPETSSVS